MDRNLKTAINLAKAGFKVFPCVGYGLKYKNPVSNINWGSQATTDLKIIQHWWKEHSYSIPSISLKNTKYFVLDADVKYNINGIANLEKLFKEFNTDLNIYAQTYTPTGGRHYYFKLPNSDINIRSTNNNMPNNIDVKGNNSCIISRSCITKEGLEYKCGKEGCIKITETCLAPQWLIDKLTKSKENNYVPFSINTELLKEDRINKYFYTILSNALDDLAKSREGNRNNNLNKISFKLTALLNINYISYNELFTLLHKTALTIGLNTKESIQTINNAINRGKNQCFIAKDFTYKNNDICIIYKGNKIC